MNLSGCTCERVENPEKLRIYGEDFVSTVLILNTPSDFTLEKQVVELTTLKWHEERQDAADDLVFKYLTLDEIAEQLGRNGTIMLIIETPTEGVIYRYGNHGNFWEIVGRMCGYA